MQFPFGHVDLVVVRLSSGGDQAAVASVETSHSVVVASVVSSSSGPHAAGAEGGPHAAGAEGGTHAAGAEGGPLGDVTVCAESKVLKLIINSA